MGRFRMGGRDVEDTTYELYSVCNHHGSDLQGGHYTAVCRNPTDGQWYSFDDVHTKQIPESEVVTKDAYILFYQKSCLSPASSSSSSSSGSGQDHWVYRMPDFTYKTKSEMKCAPTAKPRPTKKEAKKVALSSSKPGTPGTGQKFVRNSAKYATLPAKRRRRSQRPNLKILLNPRKKRSIGGNVFPFPGINQQSTQSKNIPYHEPATGRQLDNLFYFILQTLF